MSIHNIAEKLERGQLRTPSATPIGLFDTDAGYLMAYGTTVPTDASEGYATGCVFIHTDGGNNTALYVNEGTEASCDFNLVTVDSPVDWTGLTATVSEINQACDESANCEIVTATNVIAASESGKTFFLNSATEFVSTLPAPAVGLRYTFIVTGAPSGADYTITTNASANVIIGQALTVDVNSATDPDFETAGCDTISFVSAKSVVGDRVELISDGTNWFAVATCSVFDAITFTTAS